CPLFTRCDFAFTLACMGTCATDPFGEDIASSMSLNDPTCDENATCPTDCPGAPRVSIPLFGTKRVCVGEAGVLSAPVTNTGLTPEDIDTFIDYQPSGSFTAVPPGATVTGTRMFFPTTCPYPDRHALGAVARNTICAAAVGDESQINLLCDPEACGAMPPDCSRAHATVTELFPPNGQLVPVQVAGVVDPDGDPVSIQILRVTSDEGPGLISRPRCPDAFVDGPNQLRLRAERDPQGNGRVYVIDYEARDPSAHLCSGSVRVCVPRKPGAACIEDSPLVRVEFCDFAGAGDGHPSGGIDAIPEAGGLSVTLRME